MYYGIVQVVNCMSSRSIPEKHPAGLTRLECVLLESNCNNYTECGRTQECIKLAGSSIYTCHPCVIAMLRSGWLLLDARNK